MNKAIFAISLLVLGLILLAAKCNRNIEDDASAKTDATENVVVKKVQPKQPVYDSPDDSMKAMEALVNPDFVTGESGKSPQNAGQIQASDDLKNRGNTAGSPGPPSSTGRTIIVGQGGGFTGAVTTHSLTQEGQYKKTSSLKEVAAKIMQKEQSITSTTFADFSSLNIESIDFQKPGNMYYFVGYREGEVEKKVIWGSAQDAPPAEVKAFYDNFYKNIIN